MSQMSEKGMYAQPAFGSRLVEAPPHTMSLVEALEQGCWAGL